MNGPRPETDARCMSNRNGWQARRGSIPIADVSMDVRVPCGLIDETRRA